MLFLGIDVGSTTAKLVLTDGDKIVYEKYERHHSKVREKIIDMLTDMKDVVSDKPISLSISGSAGLGIAEAADIPFIQEVFATGEVVKALEPDTSCVIELGGEDAKIIFFGGGIDERMNGSCAGGTGAFIDQMSSLLNVTADELDTLSLNATKIYPIASRCGVFAKTDIQPLLNQGARKEDIAKSIYQAVVNQTVTGLAQGRKISGKVMFLGGPLHYCKGLRDCFKTTLKLSDSEALFPEYGRFAVALGAAYNSKKNGITLTIDECISRIKNVNHQTTVSCSEPLFASKEEYDKFIERHSLATIPRQPIESYSGAGYLGIDCGSTTTKLILISAENKILYSYYSSNNGNPVEIVKEELKHIYELCGERIKICGSAVTGYGEDLIKQAFGIDYGIVETIAHFKAAKYFRNDVDFILDIGGQDIKCFKIRNNAIDSIMLNEACSSGCGSFLETFAKSMGYSIEEFAKIGLFAKNPVNLGSRCTVFMNSSVKQAQKDGADVGAIAAGLSISVVKNALYKVIRAASPSELGQNIVVQGGTFHNNSVLRAFERELGHDVIRPNIAGLMGAFGAALYSSKCKESSIISPEKLENFYHTSKAINCSGCSNNCQLTINTFADGSRYISGNRCEKALGIAKSAEKLPNLYEYKRSCFLSMPKSTDTHRGTLGLPLALGMYELLPLWHALFSALGFDVVISDMSTRRTYENGQFSIPSDTACYPAKIMHGHIYNLLSKSVDYIFYPCLTYNINEKVTDNHYNCPIVAYYSELLAGNISELENVKFLYPYLNINNQAELARELHAYLNKNVGEFSESEIKKAVKYGFKKYDEYMDSVRGQGKQAIEYAREHNKRIMILAGRPYHVDPEINHGIDKLASSLGFVVVSEDSVCRLTSAPKNVRVLNQWTYHGRLYRAAKLAAENDDIELVQLVSFGCGVDAITTDEVRSILEASGKYYTQLKIDEITNLGSIKIRLRSLIGALDERSNVNGK